MSEIKKYLNEEGLGVVASEINTKLTQYTIMPTASADYTGKIIQYIGNSTDTYTQGFFYTSIIDDDTNDPVTYKWQEIELGGSTLTFNDNDFDVDNNTVALSATQRIFKGITAEWDALTEEEKSNFELVCLTDDSATGETVDAVTDGDMRAVTSNAVYDAILNNVKKGKYTSKGVYTYNGATYFIPGIYAGYDTKLLVFYVNGENNCLGVCCVNGSDVSGFSYVDGVLNNSEWITYNNERFPAFKVSNDSDVGVAVFELGLGY